MALDYTPTKIDVYEAVWAPSLNRVIKSGEQDVEVPAHECAPWLANNKTALLSSERVEEEDDTDASGPTETPGRDTSPDEDDDAGADDGDVGD